jgi:predicted branched-subunit amino acid permease
MPRALRENFGRDLRKGAVAAAVLLPSIGLYSLGFGMMAGTAGLTLAEASFFSAWVFAGAAQMASLEGWAYPVPLLFVCLVTAAMNARYLLMGATLRPVLAGYRASAAYGALFFMGDLNWALTLREREPSFNPVAFLLGSGVLMWSVWLAATLAGHVFGQVLGDPRRFAIDFMLAAFFTAMAVTFWSRARNPAPFLVAILVAVVVQRLVPGPWYILLGALAGSLAGAFRHARTR